MGEFLGKIGEGCGCLLIALAIIMLCRMDAVLDLVRDLFAR